MSCLAGSFLSASQNSHILMNVEQLVQCLINQQSTDQVNNTSCNLIQNKHMKTA